ncbi:MAG: hypothetical protein AAF680_00605 [Pseudomonadota bacterium]
MSLIVLLAVFVNRGMDRWQSSEGRYGWDMCSAVPLRVGLKVPDCRFPA